MKKILFTASAFFFFPFGAYAATPAGTESILKWADEEISQIHDGIAEVDRKMEEYRKKNDIDLKGVRIDFRFEFSSRLELGLSDFTQSIGLLFHQKNACLVRDVSEIENRIGRLIHIVSNADVIARPDSLQTELEQHLKKATILLTRLFFFKDALQEYGPLKSDQWKTVQKSFQTELKEAFAGDTVPPELLSVVLADSSYSSDTACPHPYNFGFYQLREEFAQLMDKIDQIKKFSQEMTNVSSLFNSAKSYFTDDKKIEQRKKRARKQANAWFKKNIEYPLQQIGVHLVYGSPYLQKTKDSADKQDQNDRNLIEKQGEVKKTFADVVKEGEVKPRKDIYSELWEAEAKRLEEIQYRQTVQQSLRRAEDIDDTISSTLDTNVIPILLKLEEKNTLYPKLIQALFDLCGSMPTCDQ